MSKTISDFSDVLKKIIETGGGKDTLRDKRKTKSLLNDLAPGDNFSGQKKLLDDAYSCNAVNILLDADSSADRHQKAVEAAREKLKNNFTAESGINIILKDICDALGWDTKKLFEDNSAKQQEASSPNRPVFVMDSSEPEVKPVISERDNYRQEYSQPFSHPEPVHRNTEVNTQSQSIPIAPAQKKKSPFMTVLKIAAVLIVIGVIYNLGKGSNSNENIVVDETQNTAAADMSETTQAVTTTEAAAVAENITPAIVEEAITETTTAEAITEAVTDVAEITTSEAAAVVAVTETPVTTTAPVVATTTVPTTTTQATTTITADPNAGKYVITDLVKLDYDQKMNNDRFITYVSDTNMMYYLNASGDLHEYNLASQSDNVIVTGEDVIKKVTGTSANSLTDNKKYSGLEINGVAYNSYNKKIYLFGYGYISGYPYAWVYEVESGTYVWSTTNNNSFWSLMFLDEGEFVAGRAGRTGWCVGNFTSGKIMDYSAIDQLYDIFEVDGYFYGYEYRYETLEFVGIENIYMERSTHRLFTKKADAFGVSVKNNTVYYKDGENNVFIFNMTNLTEEEYISSDMIVQNGRSFLSEDSCTGVFITNDGGFITYDNSDGKIKYVSKH